MNLVPLGLPERSNEPRGKRQSLAPGDHAVLLLPANWRIHRGEYRSHEVPTAMLLERFSAIPALIPARTLLWPRYPARVVVQDATDRNFDPCRQQIATALQLLETVFGSQVFKLDSAGDTKHTIAVTCDLTSSSALGITNAVGECDLVEGQMDGCKPYFADYAEVRVSPESPLAVLLHELLHAVGLGHTCIVPSIMITEFSASELLRCGRVRHSGGFFAPLELDFNLSEFDVAATEILQEAAAALADGKADYLHWAIREPSR